MKINRKAFLKTANYLGISALFGPARAFAATGGSTGSPVAPHPAFAPQKLKAEPMVASSFPTHPRFHSAGENMAVVITAEGIERLDWEVRPEKTCWILSLPEMGYISGKKLSYQTGMDWTQAGNVWSFTNGPLRDLLGCWEFDGNDNRVPLRRIWEVQRPIIGRQAASIRTDQIGCHYAVTAKNTSNQTWKDVNFMVCLCHYQASMIGHRPFFRINDRWPAYQDIPGVGVRTFLPIKGLAREYATLYEKELMVSSVADENSLSFPGAVCWNITGQGPFLVCHCAKDAVAVASNQNWPCNDILLWFGDMEPGEERTRNGHVIVAKSNLHAFAPRADAVLAQMSI